MICDHSINVVSNYPFRLGTGGGSIIDSVSNVCLIAYLYSKNVKRFHPLKILIKHFETESCVSILARGSLKYEISICFEIKCFVFPKLNYNFGC